MPELVQVPVELVPVQARESVPVQALEPALEPALVLVWALAPELVQGAVPAAR